jgi:hypothetical protein
MIQDSRLAALTQFTVWGLKLEAEIALVDGSFNREGLEAGSRGWLFVSETESSLADIVTLEGTDARLDVPNWSMTRHVRVDAILPWLNVRWQPHEVATLLDETSQWRRVEYRATDALVFAKATLQCSRCGWTATADLNLPSCQCGGELQMVEIFGNKEACFPLEPDERFVEIRAGSWDHEHCLICYAAVGRETSTGYRESSVAEGPNSLGIWLCDRCFERYMKPGDFSFLITGSTGTGSSTR